MDLSVKKLKKSLNHENEFKVRQYVEDWKVLAKTKLQLLINGLECENVIYFQFFLNKVTDL